MTINTNRIIELSLVFFISLFSFSIGTFVGKKYSDNQHRLAQLEPNKKIEPTDGNHASEQTDTHSTTNEHGDSPKDHDAKAEAHGETKPEQASDGEITDADVAKLAEEFANQPETTVPKKDSTRSTETTSKNESHNSVSHHAATQKTSEKEIKEVSTNEVSTERDIASIPAKVNSAPIAQQYTVQIGSYPEEAEAKKISDSLVARGYKANTIPALIKGKTWYRVQVGQFKTTAEAQEYKKDLMEKNRLTSAIVQKITPTE